MDIRDTEVRDQSIPERAETLTNELKVPPDAAVSAARDRNAPQQKRKPASEDVELDRIAAAQAQNAHDGKKAAHE